MRLRLRFRGENSGHMLRKLIAARTTEEATLIVKQASNGGNLSLGWLTTARTDTPLGSKIN